MKQIARSRSQSPAGSQLDSDKSLATIVYMAVMLSQSPAGAQLDSDL